MFRKAIVAVIGSVLAVSMLPALSSAAWKQNHQAIQADVQFGLTGNFTYQYAAGGIQCQITFKVQLLAKQTTGQIEGFLPHPINETMNCKGVGGYAFCQTHELEPQQGAMWQLHTEAFQTTQPTTVAGVTHQNAAVATAQEINSQATGGFCPIKSFKLSAGRIGIVPEEETITNVQMSGILQAEIQTSNGTTHKEHVVVSGTQQIESVSQRNIYSF